MEINTLQRKNQIESDATPRVKGIWPLIVGLFIVLTISILAIIGPTIAPKDPSEEHNISMIEGTWYIPPFDIGTPGYPLGSDRSGRDLFSRLLWGIRPTMVMVFIVAIVRLFLGVIIGLSAGWFSGKTGRFLNSLIQVALALPVLLVALGAIAIVGVELESGHSSLVYPSPDGLIQRCRYVNKLGSLKNRFILKQPMQWVQQTNRSYPTIS